MRYIATIFFFLMFAATISAQQKHTIFDDAEFIVDPVKMINTVGSDISPFFVNGELYFSSIPEDYFNKQRRERKNKAFYNMYSAAVDADGMLISERNLLPGFGAEYHEGPADYCKATGELFITLSNVMDSDTILKMFPEERIRLRLAIKKMIDGEWQTVEELPFNDDKYMFAHPAISSTGDTLVFASNYQLPDDGNVDLFMSVRNNGGWSAPIRLNDTINTPGKEMFPTFIEGGLLSFASNGRTDGYGGLDIYYTTFPETGEVINLGNQVNTLMDDFGLRIHPNGNIGYFASNNGTVGSDDIFSLHIIKQYRNFNGTVLDELTHLPIAGATVYLRQCGGAIIDSTYTSSEGGFSFTVLDKNCPVVIADKANYEPDSKDIEGLQTVELLLMPQQKYDVLVLDVETGDPISAARFSCDNASNGATNTTGIVSFRKPYPSCDMRVEKDGYLAQSFALNEAKFDLLAAKDTVWLYKKELNKTFVLENIYYDFDKWDILPESEIELDKLVKIMTDNPEIKVELGSHTDSRGSDSYNQWLSKKRSDSAVAYIIAKGISENRIVAKGYGETQLVNRCANGVECSDAEHRKNRRTEFKIIGL